jgi:hypothetical protein
MVCDQIGLSDRSVTILAFQHQDLGILHFLDLYSHLFRLAANDSTNIATGHGWIRLSFVAAFLSIPIVYHRLKRLCLADVPYLGRDSRERTQTSQPLLEKPHECEGAAEKRLFKSREHQCSMS